MTKKPNRIKVEGIENFNPKTDNEDNYLLFYPMDLRFSQDKTVVKEVNNKGKIVKEYEINDKDFFRMNINQRPQNNSELEISFFGDASIDNYFYKYNIKDRQFKKIELDYFDYDVGVNHINTYGDDMLFDTLVSHKTGDQNYNIENDTFQVSISNYSNKKSFEIEHGYEPSGEPILSFNDKILYSTISSPIKGKNIGPSKMGVIDMDKQEVRYLELGNFSSLHPLFTNNEYAYIIDEEGMIYIINKEFDIHKYKLFSDESNIDRFSIYEAKPIFIDNYTALITVFSEERGHILGTINFNEEPKFKEISLDYIKKGYNYRTLYMDPLKEEIYIVKHGEMEESLLVINSNDLSLKNEIPITHSNQLDFVVKTK